MALTDAARERKPWKRPAVRSGPVGVPNLFGCSGATPICCSDGDFASCTNSCAPPNEVVPNNQC